MRYSGRGVADGLAGLMASLDEAPPPTLEEVLTSPEWFGLETASPLQRAVCRWAEGLPVDHDTLEQQLAEAGEAYGPDIAERMQLSWVLGGLRRVTVRPVELALIAGIRTAKSLLDAAVAVWASQTVTIPGNVRQHEKIRFSIVSVDKDKAKAVLMHLKGAVLSSAMVASLVVGETTEGVDLRHPSGRTIEVRVVHGGAAGKGLVAYWSAGCIFDEAPRMVGEDEGKVNLDDARRGVLHRLLPGAQVWYTGSPWAPMGPVYDMVAEHHGDPGDTLVIRAAAPALNPVTWTPERCEEARERDAKGENDPNKGSFRTDVRADWGQGERQMFDEPELVRVMLAHAGAQAEPILEPWEHPPVEGVAYSATMDPSGRGGNAWTMSIWGRCHDGRLRQVVARQAFPNAEHTEADVLREWKPLLDLYGVTWVSSDQYACGFVQTLAREVGIYIAEFKVLNWTSKNILDAYDSLRMMIRQKRIWLLDAPKVREDLLRVRRRLTPNGAAIYLPETGDGRHCDYAPTIAMAAVSPMAQPEVKKTKEEKVAEWEAASKAAEFAPSKPKRRGFSRRRR